MNVCTKVFLKIQNNKGTLNHIRFMLGGQAGSGMEAVGQKQL